MVWAAIVGKNGWKIRGIWNNSKTTFVVENTIENKVERIFLKIRLDKTENMVENKTEIKTGNKTGNRLKVEILCREFIYYLCVSTCVSQFFFALMY